MSKAELLFRRFLDKAYPHGFVLKVPDYKQTGSAALRGLPDFMVIDKGATFWYEVKYTPSLRSFNLNGLNAHQWIICHKMLQAGYDVIIVVYNADYEAYIERFSVMLHLRQNGLSTILFKDMCALEK